MKYFFDKLKTHRGDIDESIEICRTIASHLENITGFQFDQLEQTARNKGEAGIGIGDYADLRIIRDKGE